MNSEREGESLDQKRLDKIKYRILKIERDNLHSRAKTDEIIETLRQLIEEEVNKWS